MKIHNVYIVHYDEKTLKSHSLNSVVFQTKASGLILQEINSDASAVNKSPRHLWAHPNLKKLLCPPEIRGPPPWTCQHLIPSFVADYRRMTHSIQLHKGSSRAMPVANLFSITFEERLVKLTRHTESAGRKQSEAKSNNHSCMAVNKKPGKLCPPVADCYTVNNC